MSSRSQTLPESNCDYNKVDYWNCRYENEDSFDWCKKYADFKHLLDKIIKPDDKILMIGMQKIKK